jgi:hypothetical protein
MAHTQTKPSRWYPTTGQLKDPDAVERALRQVLDQHYALQDQFHALSKAHADLKAATTGDKMPGHGPADTRICGLFVQPVDTNTMANGATLKFNRTQGNFSFQ